MAFTMKGPKMYPNYKSGTPYKSPLHEGEEKTTSDKGDKSVETGDIKWEKEKKVSEKTTNSGSKSSTTTNYETKGTSKGKKVEKQLDKNDPDYEKKLEAWKNAPEKNKEKYRNKTHVKNRSETTTKNKEELIKIPPRKIKLIPKTEMKPVEPGKMPDPKKTPPPPPPRKKRRKRRGSKINWRQTGLKIRNAVRKVNPIRGIKKMCKGDTCYS